MTLSKKTCVHQVDAFRAEAMRRINARFSPWSPTYNPNVAVRFDICQPPKPMQGPFAPFRIRTPLTLSHSFVTYLQPISFNTVHSVHNYATRHELEYVRIPVQSVQ